MPVILNPEKLAGVQPKLVEFVRWVVTQVPFDVKITEGVRSDATQREYWKHGRDAAGNVIDPAQVWTYAKDASQSPHGRGGAVDLWPVVGGKDVRSGATEVRILGELGEKFGLIWGGRWTDKFPPYGDQPHFELKSWRNLPMPVLIAVGTQLVLIVGGLTTILGLWLKHKLT